MSSKVFRLLVAAALLGSVPWLAQAHHSFPVLFDPSADVTVAGIVTEFQFKAPHSYILIEAIDANGASTAWELETASPGQLIRLGLTPQILKPGDRVSATGNPARDGRPLMRLRTLTLPSGTTLQVQ
jgi:hypothetical protein